MIPKEIDTNFMESDSPKRQFHSYARIKQHNIIRLGQSQPNLVRGQEKIKGRIKKL